MVLIFISSVVPPRVGGSRRFEERGLRFEVLILIVLPHAGERWYAVPKGEDRDLRFEEVETSSQEMSDGQTVSSQASDFGPILRASPSSFLRKEPALRAGL